ncbi:heterodimeric geranylgeranyl pyrophosphate synthase small subunit, chloroplastic [Elaeis guineensis]|uniref:LOW QUALITY PROTEIN: heterodimeric geranylgeranyl pyrophosphate synthase small subunit, chloroplastic n=1 Tax=Elaeis guineensis var. tenera TaxID=51953 RepID=A0A6I9Q9M2_ELAGV|nr:LOW QUALITY PROTEIN: heterodimeric geranylgeranyl pyrophosphate synthase small subunit, chloroplastic [Elaeis guineensis]
MQIINLLNSGSQTKRSDITKEKNPKKARKKGLNRPIRPQFMAFSALFFSPNFALPKMFPPRPLTPKFPLLRCSSTSPAAAAAASFDLRGYWTTLLPQIESQLDAALPVRFPERIFEAMRYSVLAGGGKRAPPIMCIAACELVGGDRSAAFPTACALEMIHAASLVHDDLPCFDAAPLRRGRPSTHARFGVDMAVLAGDALFPLAFSHVVARTPRDLVPPATVLRALAEIARAVGSTGMAAGQFLDLTGAAAAGEADVVAVLEKKFGEMAECSAVCGGILGGAGEEEAEGLRRYGRAVGVLYELVDDILMADAGSNGKMRSNARAVAALGMERAMEMVGELQGKAKRELQRFGDKYGDRVLPLYSFVDYAVERGFVVEAGGEGEVAAASASASATGDGNSDIGVDGNSGPPSGE